MSDKFLRGYYDPKSFSSSSSSSSFQYPPPSASGARYERREDRRDDSRRDDIRRDEIKREDNRRDEKNWHHKPLFHTYSREDHLRDKRKHVEKEERDRDRERDKVKRPREDNKFGSSEFNSKDALELNMKLQIKVKGLKEEINSYRGEIVHLRKLVDTEHQEKLKLKREVNELEEELSRKKHQIMNERSQREVIFQENEQLINKLEAEVLRLRMMCPPLMPPLPALSLSLPPSMISPIMPIIPTNPNDTFSQKVKEGIAKHSERCIWISGTSMPSDELAKVLGGSANVDSIFIHPRTSAAFILFHNVDKAIEGVSVARTTLCAHTAVRCNLVNNAVWVGNVFCSEAELCALFSTCGEIESVRVMMSSHCAFVTYARTIAAITACCELDNSFLGTTRIAVNFKYYAGKGPDMGGGASAPHVPVCHVLYVGELDHAVSRDDLMNVFAAYGDVQDVWMPKDGDYAFVTLGGVEEAVVAKHHLQGRRMGAKNLRINYRKNIEPKEAFSDSLVIKTTPPLINEDTLRGIVIKYGKISSISETKMRPGEWMVTMTNNEEAIVLKGHLHSRAVGGTQFYVEYLSKVKAE